MTWILATVGSRYILVEDDNVEGGDLPGDAMGRILDAENARLFPPQNIHSILAHMPYAEFYVGPQEVLPELLDGVERVGHDGETE